MTTFKDLNDEVNSSTPVELETLAKGRIAQRARRQRMLASGLAGLLIVAFAGVAFAIASTGSNSGTVNSTDKGRKTEIRENETSSTDVTVPGVTESTASDDGPNHDLNDDNGVDSSVDDNGVHFSGDDSVDDSGHDSTSDDDSADDSNDDSGDDSSDDDSVDGPDDSGDDNSGPGSSNSGKGSND